MRMRRMKNLEPRMEKCADIRILEPAAYKGKWRSLMPECKALWVEVGCGKGKFTAETAQANPDVLLIAVERCREAMVVAMEKANAMGLKNVYLHTQERYAKCTKVRSAQRQALNTPKKVPPTRTIC